MIPDFVYFLAGIIVGILVDGWLFCD